MKSVRYVKPFVVTAGIVPLREVRRLWQETAGNGPKEKGIRRCGCPGKRASGSANYSLLIRQNFCVPPPAGLNVPAPV
jgi:hypothetical protein